MRLLLDTQLAFWWQTGSANLPSQARVLVEESTDPVFISMVSLWEMAIKSNIGKMKIDLPIFAHQVSIIGFSWLPIEKEHILKMAILPIFDDHKDPFDRLLVAQSMAEPLTLLTTDNKLARYGSTIQVL